MNEAFAWFVLPRSSVDVALSCGRCKMLWPWYEKLCIFWAVNIQNTNLLNTFAFFPDAETWRWQHGEPLPLSRVDTLFCDHQSHGHLWMVSCNHYKWQVLKLFVTIRDHVTYDHSWLSDNDDHLFGKSFSSNNCNVFLKYFIFFFFRTSKTSSQEIFRSVFKN